MRGSHNGSSYELKLLQRLLLFNQNQIVMGFIVMGFIL